MSEPGTKVQLINIRNVRRLFMDIENTREEILRRSRIIEKKRRENAIRIMEAGCSLLLFALVVVVGRSAALFGTPSTATYYGTLLLGKEAGSYIIVGVICFFLGMLVAFIAAKKREGRKEENSEQ